LNNHEKQKEQIHAQQYNRAFRKPEEGDDLWLVRVGRCFLLDRQDCVQQRPGK